MEAIAIPSALDRILYKLGSEDQATARELIDEMMGRSPSGAGYAGGEAVGRYWGTRLRQRRLAVGLSRSQVAALSGLSEGTIKNVEAGHHAPTVQTLSRLMAVPGLALTGELEGVQDSDAASTPNCWIAPGFDPIYLINELIAVVNSRGGEVEQSLVYLDHASAAKWVAVTRLQSFAAVYNSYRFEAVADSILKAMGNVGVDLIALGSGTGQAEARLASQLLDRSAVSDLRLYLIDISQPLLSVAFRNAADALADRRGVAITAIQGNFHHLPRYTQILYTPRKSSRRRLVTMLGGTFHNLDNELSFVRRSLSVFQAGDLLLLDVATVAAPADRPDLIRKLDPRLSGAIPADWTQPFDEWLGGPLRRYGQDVESVTFRSELTLRNCIPGSYCIEYLADVTTPAGKRSFAMHHWKRYDTAALSQALRESGWETLVVLPFSDNYPRVLLLACKSH